jgi:hypothetical protein
MRRFALVSILSIVVLFSGHSRVVQPQADGLQGNAPSAQDRLVVFEAFLRPT